MIRDYLEIRNAEGMPKLMDGNIALGFLLNAKAGVRNYAIALTESVTPEVKSILSAQLQDAIALHEEITDLMINKGWFYPVNLDKQFRLDLESSTTISQIAGMDLFSGRTNRLGLFATKEK